MLVCWERHFLEFVLEFSKMVHSTCEFCFYKLPNYGLRVALRVRPGQVWTIFHDRYWHQLLTCVTFYPEWLHTQHHDSGHSQSIRPAHITCCICRHSSDHP